MKKILIVDDEKSFLLSLKDGLSTHSDKFQILTAENGREAVSILRTVAVDLLVTDLKLPEMNGFELLAWTSRHQPQLPVIVMSAFGTPEIEARLAKMDTLQFLEKPLDIQMLEEGIFNGLNTGGKSFIRGITLATFLQLMKVERKNCTLKIAHSDQSAYLYVRRGELIDAEFDELTGLEAALEIVSWSDAEIEMDGICRRQEDVIKLPMEHLLIEAFKRKDEAAELNNATPQDVDEQVNGFLDDLTKVKIPVAIPVAETLKQLAKILLKLPPVVEYAIFDEKGIVLKKNPGKCQLAGIDPVGFDSLLAGLADDLKLGPYRSVTFNSASRNRYLQCYYEQYRILLKLKPGTQSQQVVKDIERLIHR